MCIGYGYDVVFLVDVDGVWVGVCLGVVISSIVMCVLVLCVVDFIVGYMIVNDLIVLYVSYYCLVICYKCCDGFCLMGLWIVDCDDVFDVDVFDIIVCINGEIK